MKTLIKPLQFLYVIYAVTLFIVLMLPVFLWALLVSLLGRDKGGNLLYYACRLWADVWFPLIFIWHKNIYIDKPAKHGAYIFVANHISYLDAAILPKTFRQPVRPLGKVEMTKIPIFGTIYKNVIVTVDRSSAANRTRSVQELKSLLKREISILVFPEGTFNSTSNPLKEFYDGAFKIAIETGTPIRPVLFLKTYDRMHQSSLFTFNPGQSRSVFLKEIPVAGYNMDDVAALREKVYTAMEQALIERKASWIKKKQPATIV